MDLWIARRDDGKPSPVVFFFHGGGFRAGSRFEVAAPTWDLRKPLLAAGISVVSIDYRLDPSLKLPEKLADIARSVQWLRHHAAEYHIDTERVAAYGSSAGAGAAFWLATHDDMANPDSADPVLRQSTRLAAVGGFNVQATYDVRQWGKLLDIPEGRIQEQYQARIKQTSDAEFQAIQKDYDMLAMLDAHDPPMHFENDQNPPEQMLGHYPGHLVAIKRKADQLGVECVLGNLEDRGKFFIRHLNRER